MRVNQLRRVAVVVRPSKKLKYLTVEFSLLGVVKKLPFGRIAVRNEDPTQSKFFRLPNILLSLNLTL